MVNSVYYRGVRRFTTVREAIVRVGYRQIREMLLATAFSLTCRRSIPLYRITSNEFWQHSLATALSADKIARITLLEEPDVCYLAGLLHDVGRIAMGKGLLQGQINLIGKIIDKNKCCFPQGEFEVLGFTHGELGAVLLDGWAVDERTIAAIAQHHSDMTQAGALARIIHVADVLASQAGYPSPRDGWASSFDDAVFEQSDFPQLLRDESSEARADLLQEIRQDVLEASKNIEL
jgi:putative nucleotidyltransferase with HDIG domain